ncbi:MAG: hypothetical protein AABW52_05830 [Nanoarchaeota archaeon]
MLKKVIIFLSVLILLSACRNTDNSQGEVNTTDNSVQNNNMTTLFECGYYDTDPIDGLNVKACPTGLSCYSSNEGNKCMSDEEFNNYCTEKCGSEDKCIILESDPPQIACETE